MRCSYLPIRAWPAADRGGLYGRPANGIFIKATLNRARVRVTCYVINLTDLTVARTSAKQGQ